MARIVERSEDDRHLRRIIRRGDVKLYVGEEGVTGAELTDEFGALLAKDLPARLKRLPSKPKAFLSPVRTWPSLVELIRPSFEPRDQ